MNKNTKHTLPRDCAMNERKIVLSLLMAVAIVAAVGVSPTYVQATGYVTGGCTGSTLSEYWNCVNAGATDPKAGEMAASGGPCSTLPGNILVRYTDDYDATEIDHLNTDFTDGDETGVGFGADLRKPIGGWDKYYANRIYTKTEVEAMPLNKGIVVRVSQGFGPLKSAIVGLGSQGGGVVFIEDDSNPMSLGIKLTGQIKVPANVTIASNRGELLPSGEYAPGALLFLGSDDANDDDLDRPIIIDGDNVRITGLRLRGPQREVIPWRDAESAIGISNGFSQYTNSGNASSDDLGFGHKNLEVDNCELSQWAHAAVFVGHQGTACVRNNHIHHNQRWKLGYGVGMQGESTAVVEENLFAFNRHDVAATGFPKQSYVARHNVTLGNVHHSYDMHGLKEICGKPDSNGWDCKTAREALPPHNIDPWKVGVEPAEEYIAGESINIYHNTITTATIDNRPFDMYARIGKDGGPRGLASSINIRGFPQKGAWIRRNSFGHSRRYHKDGSFKQTQSITIPVSGGDPKLDLVLVPESPETNINFTAEDNLIDAAWGETDERRIFFERFEQQYQGQPGDELDPDEVPEFEDDFSETVPGEQFAQWPYRWSAEELEDPDDPEKLKHDIWATDIQVGSEVNTWTYQDGALKTPDDKKVIGEVRSVRFTVPQSGVLDKYLRFEIAGFSAHAEIDGIDLCSYKAKYINHVALYRAYDDKNLAKVNVPCSATPEKRVINLRPFAGQKVYLVLADGDPDETHGWISVDNIEIIDSEPVVWDHTSPDGSITKNGAPYFPIGLWNIPGYTFKTATDDDSGNQVKFEEAAGIFNNIYVQAGRTQEYMGIDSDNALMTGSSHFKWKFGEGFTESHGLYDIHQGEAGLDHQHEPDDDRKYLDFAEVKELRARLTDIEDDSDLESFKEYVRREIVDEIQQEFGLMGNPTVAPTQTNNYVWLLPDQPADHVLGDFVDNWYLHPEILSIYNSTIKEATDGRALTVVDVTGSLKGNKFLYEEQYNATQPNVLMAETDLAIGAPPGDPNNFVFPTGDIENVRSYKVAHDGTRVHQWIGTEWLTQDAAPFRDKYEENLRKTIEPYCHTADVIGLNAYLDFAAYTDAAGLAVDVIKDKCGLNKPVWLWFDGAALKREDIATPTNEQYLKHVKSQVYTAINHGVNGIHFFSKENLNEDTSLPDKEPYWDLLKDMVLELKTKMPMVYASVLHKDVWDGIDYTIRDNGEEGVNKKYYLIAVNTSVTETKTLFHPTIQPRTLAPLEVFADEVSYGSPSNFTLSGDLVVPAGETLTLGPGTTMKFAAGDASSSGVDAGKIELIVYGTLELLGTGQANGLVQLESESEPSNNMAWQGIRVMDGGTANFSYAVIKNAKEAIYLENGATVDWGPLAAEETRIYTSNIGVRAHSLDKTTTPILRNISMQDVNTGVWLGGSDYIEVRNMCLEGSDKGVFVDNSDYAKLRFLTIVPNNDTGVGIEVKDSNVTDIRWNYIGDAGTGIKGVNSIDETVVDNVLRNINAEWFDGIAATDDRNFGFGCEFSTDTPELICQLSEDSPCVDIDFVAAEGASAGSPKLAATQSSLPDLGRFGETDLDINGAADGANSIILYTNTFNSVDDFTHIGGNWSRHANETLQQTDDSGTTRAWNFGPSSADYTVEARIKINGVEQDPGEARLLFLNADVDEAYRIDLLNNTGDDQVQIVMPGHSQAVNLDIVVGKWYTVAAHISNGQVKVYVDENLVFGNRAITDDGVSGWTNAIGLGTHQAWVEFDDVNIIDRTGSGSMDSGGGGGGEGGEGGEAPYTELFSDDFSDGNADGWSVESGGWTVGSGSYLTVGGGVPNITTVGETYWDNYAMEVKMSGVLKSGVLVRAQDANNGIYLIADPPNNIYWNHRQNGDWGQPINPVDFSEYTESSIFKVKVIADGDELEAWVSSDVIPGQEDYHLKTNFSGAPLGSGKVGLYGIPDQLQGFDDVIVCTGFDCGVGSGGFGTFLGGSPDDFCPPNLPPYAMVEGGWSQIVDGSNCEYRDNNTGPSTTHNRTVRHSFSPNSDYTVIVDFRYEEFGQWNEAHVYARWADINNHMGVRVIKRSGWQVEWFERVGGNWNEGVLGTIGDLGTDITYTLELKVDGPDYRAVLKQNGAALNPPYNFTFPNGNLNSGTVALGTNSAHVAFKEVRIYDHDNTGGSKPLVQVVPEAFRLHQNRPNPFNPETQIVFDLPEQGQVRLEIFDILGQKVRTVVNEELPVGRYHYVWDGRNQKGQEVASGIYLYRLHAADQLQTRKMTLLR